MWGTRPQDAVPSLGTQVKPALAALRRRLDAVAEATTRSRPPVVTPTGTGAVLGKAVTPASPAGANDVAQVAVRTVGLVTRPEVALVGPAAGPHGPLLPETVATATRPRAAVVGPPSTDVARTRPSQPVTPVTLVPRGPPDGPVPPLGLVGDAVGHTDVVGHEGVVAGPVVGRRTPPSSRLALVGAFHTPAARPFVVPPPTLVVPPRVAGTAVLDTTATRAKRGLARPAMVVAGAEHVGPGVAVPVPDNKGVPVPEQPGPGPDAVATATGVAVRDTVRRHVVKVPAVETNANTATVAVAIAPRLPGLGPPGQDTLDASQPVVASVSPVANATSDLAYRVPF